MARGKIPSLLSLHNGPITFGRAERASKCGRCKSAISSGSRVALMKTVGGGFTTQKRLCLSCAAEIVSKTQADINTIQNELQS